MPAKSEVLIASSNRNKILEFQTILKDYPFVFLSPKDLVSRGYCAAPEVDETADSYLGNARLKAQAYFKWAQMPVLADDSGLEVEDLDNRPGIYSARYAGVDANDDQNISKLLGELAAIEQGGQVLERRAKFRCALVYIDAHGEEFTAQSNMPGVVLRERVGEGGFGYDPVIRIDALSKTLAQVDFQTTCKIGFRALAAKSLFESLLA